MHKFVTYACAGLVGIVTVTQYVYFAVLAGLALPLKYLPGLRSAYLEIATYCFNLTSIWVVAVTTWWAGTRVYRYGVAIPPHHTLTEGRKRGGAVTFNHLSFADAMMLGCFMATLQGVSSKCFRWISIRYLLNLPHGWMHWMRDDIFVSSGKSSPAAAARNEAELVRGVSDIADPNHMAQWLFFSPEGSVQTKKLFAKSIKWAGAQGLVPLKHHLLPRTKAFAVALRTLGDAVTDIFDVTLGYPRNAKDGDYGPWRPIDLALPRDGGLPIHIHCRKVPVPPAAIINDDDAFAAWLYEFFVEKDRLLDIFYATGAFPDPVASAQPAAYTWSVYSWLAQWAVLYALPAAYVSYASAAALISWLW
ncbi:1-acylglycerol-3-phosphate O-acyltransferase 3 [Thecamonas trahens ATCC 50062]|uniref:1-acylglycerol-3-phosphate O-acyltransferase 3 n=1 Tax=Thecamonas trahens ATCC 50062 TaxID=461836 RepID=A0A0L0DJ87_THETB|nr:1-acylglycerol-3-phosphate O-acyltransferase 3 [Thecamonas trahens ATCC 50062]KNC52469.1 1-acylglycerol-3-phosphate O-acyltransferase 3 [Thecamonas trahens ATCC 50062]|eukprot:XP_013755269.1 1-acylglycerol-3-phosphate O-acyltransferase 3 [Thecamonas trahens ATCC 50062]